MPVNKNVKSVNIKIFTKISQDGQTEEHHFDEKGQLVEVNGKIYLRFQEHGEDGKSVPVTYRIEDDFVRLIRDGENHLELYFRNGKTTENLYRTPYGNMKISVRTKILHSAIDAKNARGAIDVDYELLNDGQSTGNHVIRLQFKQ